jgi:selenide, water dikinase
VTRGDLKDLVLVGGGHSHVEVLRRFGLRPLDGVRITLVSRDVVTPYSGMLPGVVAGHYSPGQAHIDLQALAQFAGAGTVFDEAVGLDLAARRVLVRGDRSLPYDVLSINVGSMPRADVSGAAAHVIPVKPIDRFLDRWERVRGRLVEMPRARLAVVGGGAGGVELILAVQHRLRTALEAEGRDPSHLACQLFTASPEILPTHNARARRLFERILAARRVTVHAGSPVIEVVDRGLRTADGVMHEGADEILWTTEAGAAGWLAASGLDVDDDGFVRVSSTLESVSHANVFAAGDLAAMVEYPRPKSGVFAVRAGPPLAANLRRALLGRQRVRYRPQRQFLSLISTGDKHAVASRGPFAAHGAWVWRWKDRIDRRFMRRYDVRGGHL